MQKILKSVGILDHIKQWSDESLGDFNTHFNKELASITQVSTGRETIVGFARTLEPKGITLYDSLSVIFDNSFEEMATR